MGCPDWPRCFGLFVPPTSVEEIPAAFFDTHPEYETKAFNAFQTWVEYVNRLVGALIGLFTFATAVLSFGFWRKDKRIVFLSVAAVLMTGFEGWLGKLVVDKNLHGGMVTIHMLVAILILGTLITAVYLSTVRGDGVSAQRNLPTRLRWIGLVVVLLTVVQILIGTQVREQVDLAAMAGEGRGEWLEGLDWQYGLHRVLWMALLGVLVVWVRGLWLVPQLDRRVRWMTWALLLTLSAEVLLGISLASFELPPVLQPLHLLFANFVFALEYAILIYAFGVERFFVGASKLNDSLDGGHVINAKH